jgi:phosphate transport system protein
MTALTRSIERMGKLVAARLKDVLDAYASGEVDRALMVWTRDREVDDYYNQLFRELLTYIIEDPKLTSVCIDLMFVAKNLERIGDHATNIAEIIHYDITGQTMATERPKTEAV